MKTRTTLKDFLEREVKHSNRSYADLYAKLGIELIYANGVFDADRLTIKEADQLLKELERHETDND